jgi:Rad3-related DNA helicase
MAKKKVSILQYFPYPTIRPEQQEVLEILEAQWQNYDCFCLVMPTAAGKSAIAATLAKWAYNASIITPTNILAKQFADEFSPAIGKLNKRSMYKCPRVAEGRMNCEDAAKQFGGRKGIGCDQTCEYIADLRRSKGRGCGVYNYYCYMAHKLFKSTVIIDESHNTLKTIADLASKKLWQHDHHFPSWIWSYSDLIKWLEGLRDRSPVLEDLFQELHTTRPRYVISKTKELWKKTTPWEDRALLKLLPIDIKDSQPFLWPSSVKKVVLMSATINKNDIEELGLSRRRTLYLEASSPIPAMSRPILPISVASVNYQNTEVATKTIVDWIRLNLLDKHSGEKGLIHATYKQARLIEAELGDLGGRVLYHRKDTVKQKYLEFTESPPESGRILVASGLYEGIDLVEDLGRWQVIAKIPWLSLADPAIKFKAEENPDWFTWETAKATLQACGRICRTETDTGVTYILDSSFNRLYDNLVKADLAPQWWLDAIDPNYRRQR